MVKPLDFRFCKSLTVNPTSRRFEYEQSADLANFDQRLQQEQ
jgi:hypothetical protein